MSFNHKLRSSSSPCLIFCCFHAGHTTAYPYHEAASSDYDNSNCRKATRSPCSWLRSMALELPLPEIQHKCHSLVARIGRCQWRQGHVTVALEFGYDPMSYTLNFEDDRSRELDEEFPARNFSARLPVSPDRLLPAQMPGPSRSSSTNHTGTTSSSLSLSKCRSITSSDHHPPRAPSSAASRTARPPPPPPTTRPPPPRTTATTAASPRKAARSPCSIRYKCRSLVARVGRCRWRQGHATIGASEFGCDPMSYVLNFEDEWSRETDEELLGEAAGVSGSLATGEVA
ncbi:hypothetical protein NL676_035203 [Syzygium grande]|nr:hypothetical protein NL676_035203 [Syzygium grande]